MARNVLQILSGAFLGVWLGATPALAVLGGAPDARSAADRAVSRAVSNGTAVGDSYTVVVRDTGGTTLREYVAQTGPQAGKVFAVAWHGLAHPDLSILLGEYALEHRLTRQRLPRTHGRRLVARSARVVVEQWGQMRNLQGRAYLPARLPNELRPDDIR